MKKSSKKAHMLEVKLKIKPKKKMASAV